VLQAAGVVADDGDAVLGSDDLPAAYEYGFIGDLGVKGLTVKAFKNVEGIKRAANNTDVNISKTKGQTLGVRYNHDIFTVGVNQMKQKTGSTLAAGSTTVVKDNAETKKMEYGLGVAFNKDLSVGLYLNRAKISNDTSTVTSTQGRETEETKSIAIGYSLGPVALSAQYGRVQNMNGAADADANVMFMSLTTAF
jgi:predicted porin